MNRVINKIMIMVALLCVGFLSQARQLILSQNGEVEYIFQDHQMISLDLNNGTHQKGMLMILSDSTIKINGIIISPDQIKSIRVKEGNEANKVIGIVGLVGGTGLMALGISLMLDDDGIVGFISVIAGLVMASVGVVVDTVAIVVLALSGGKKIVVSGDLASHELSIL
tara:strand:+ start:21 stop:524 length:504 start_codon:yes stop_codon:yes gene_type:complete